MREVEGRDEFHEMLLGHLRDIGHIVTHCRRTGVDPEIIVDWLEGARETLLEFAHAPSGLPHPAPADQKPVSIRA